MGDSLFGLSTESRTIIDHYLQWTRLACDGLKRGVHLDAASHQVGNILQETYTKDELKDILSGHTALLLHSLDARIEKFAGSSAELLRAVLRDADRQRVTIKVDVDAVLNAAAAASAAPATSAATATTTTTAGAAATSLLLDHERQLLSGPCGRLAPLTVADAEGEAIRQLAEAKEEIHRLQEKVRCLADAYAQVMSMRSVDTTTLLSMSDALQLRNVAAAAAGKKEQDEALNQSVDELRMALASARLELNTRLNQSTQYQDMKRILTHKNKQIRTLRAHLAEYDPAFLQKDNDDGDMIVEEDD
ncbi:hypothetical protein TraAM80_08936 [Trypanosoma rangeli]|uniref:Leucine zipper transcription factor-like protein 1 n=1 Tax=Trypanosoma rangeli TaxID=5698 RepID=A0A422MY50_TRYRA|nr:uncharacterized protein TraAM80_08936 [Trypanosoma rangeli]RNE98158.1 hypothetical protein TraAM80_08936 [Trypanosoma rangeli]|eukprot:RNE98158.1 hypothetical protein TraAM80_08936 [Trypanosoma rangeli]